MDDLAIPFITARADVDRSAIIHDAYESDMSSDDFDALVAALYGDDLAEDR